MMITTFIRLVISITLFFSILQNANALTVDQPAFIKQMFPAMTLISEPEGDPLVRTVYEKETILGYVFETDDIIKIPAYSGKPINILLGLDIEGIIKGAYVLEHHEPILLVGIPEQELVDFAAEYTGKSVTDRVKVGAANQEGIINIDAVTGATVTVIVVNESIMRNAIKVARAKGIIESTAEDNLPPATIRDEIFEKTDWTTLTGDGSVRRLHLTRADIDKAFIGTEAEEVEKSKNEIEQKETFIDLYYAHLNIPTIGRNLLGDDQYKWLMEEIKPGEHAIAMVANGIYSFKGSGYVRGGIFDRVQLKQGEARISFRDLDYHRLDDVFAEGIPRFSEMAIFVIRAGYEFDPGKAWQLELLVRRQIGALDSVFTGFTGEYLAPTKFLEFPKPPPKVVMMDEINEPLWVSIWRQKAFQIAVLLISLVCLLFVMFFQDWLVKYPRFVHNFRRVFLAYTVIFIGWYALGQLSVVNVLTFTNAVINEFTWDLFLMDPIIFILWGFTAMTMLLWGRGVFCGWLCPFGALQELVNELARALKIKQWQVPFVIHEKLWAVKYIILLALFGLSLDSLSNAERFAEVEPFKTAITLLFQREWWFVTYAVILIAISIPLRKVYCRYICPLGAALAIPARIQIFNWLKRRKECGKPCQICAHECEIQAIHPEGEINVNECHYCLDCQVTYHDTHKCPPLVQKRKQRERKLKKQYQVTQASNPNNLETIPVHVEHTTLSK